MSMKVKDSYNISIELNGIALYFFLYGNVLAVADPVTDILTLREFYLNDHKTWPWFGVGLVFAILPSLAISLRYL